LKLLTQPLNSFRMKDEGSEIRKERGGGEKRRKARPDSWITMVLLYIIFNSAKLALVVKGKKFQGRGRENLKNRLAHLSTASLRTGTRDYRVKQGKEGHAWRGEKKKEEGERKRLPGGECVFHPQRCASSGIYLLFCHLWLKNSTEPEERRKSYRGKRKEREKKKKEEEEKKRWRSMR